MGFLTDYAALAAPASQGAQESKTPQQVALAQLALLQEWVVKKPAELFTELRAHQPIFLTPGPAIVSLYRDVMEVVNLHDVYSVAPYGQAMQMVNGGPNFILGMDSSPQLHHDQSVLRLAVRREDEAIIHSCVAACANAVVNAARPAGRLEITDGCGRLVATQLVAHYFGVPGPDPQTIMRWTRAMFQAIFLNFGQDPQVAGAGQAAGREFQQYLDGLIATLHQQPATGTTAAGTAAADTVLGRLVQMQAAPTAAFTDEGIRNNLIGCITGVIDNVNTAVANAMNVLLAKPEHLAAALAAAGAGDTETVHQYVLEALRFHPPAPVLVRMSLQDHMLARGTDRATSIPAHKLVFASNSSAMMDDTSVDDPQEFRLGRPEHHHLHFGWGLHQCLGKFIAEATVTEIAKSLLTLKGLRRAAGADGEVQYTGPFPTRFVVEFDPA